MSLAKTERFTAFIPFAKFDEAKGEVWGYAAEEAGDRSGEIMDFATAKPAFEKWSESQKEASGGLSLGNVREMHSKNAVGKLVHLEPMDVEKKFFVGAKLVDPLTLKKVKEGVLTGFSVGGDYAKRWKDGDLVRYTPKIEELSVVDRPCMPGATFTVVKADGSTETVALKGRSIQQVWSCGLVAGHEHMTKAEALKCEGEMTKAAEESDLAKAERKDEVNPKEGEKKYGDVKFADEENKKYPIDTEAHIRAAWNYINKEKNAAKYTDGGKSVKAKIVAAWKEKIDKDGPPSAEEAKKAADGNLRKCLYCVIDLASATQALQWLHECVEREEAGEGDMESKIPDSVAALISNAYAVLVEQIQEEAKEWHEEEGEEMPMEMAVAAVLKKLETSPEVCKSRLEKRAGKEIEDMKPEEFEKLVGAQNEQLAKRFEEALTKTVGDAVKPLADRIDRIEKAIPQPTKVMTRAVEKEAIVATEPDAAEKAAAAIDLTKREHNEGDARTLMKHALRQGRVF